MVRKTDGISCPDRKISETFLDFVAPLLEGAEGKATRKQFDKVLMVGFTVWNSVVYDTVNGDAKYVTWLKQLTLDDSSFTQLLDRMIARKKTLFAHDLRLIGKYKIVRKKGEWRLWAEARDPTSTH